MIGGEAHLLHRSLLKERNKRISSRYVNVNLQREKERERKKNTEANRQVRKLIEANTDGRMN